MSDRKDYQQNQQGASAKVEDSSKTSARLGTEVLLRDKAKKKKKRSGSFTKRALIIGVALIFLVFDATILATWYINAPGKPGKTIVPEENTLELISEQIESGEGKNIRIIGYDTSLVFENLESLSLVDISKLKPLENNFYRAGANPEDPDLLYDKMIINRAIRFNSSWIDYVQTGDEHLFSSVVPSSKAETKVKDLAGDAKLDYFRLAIGEIRYNENSFYLIVKVNYGLTSGAHLTVYDDIFVYELVTKGDTMLIKDFERISGKTN